MEHSFTIGAKGDAKETPHTLKGTTVQYRSIAQPTSGTDFDTIVAELRRITNGDAVTAHALIAPAYNLMQDKRIKDATWKAGTGPDGKPSRVAATAEEVQAFVGSAAFLTITKRLKGQGTGRTTGKAAEKRVKEKAATATETFDSLLNNPDVPEEAKVVIRAQRDEAVKAAADALAKLNVATPATAPTAEAPKAEKPKK